jgi:hypothetical protein
MKVFLAFAAIAALVIFLMAGEGRAATKAFFRRFWLPLLIASGVVIGFAMVAYSGIDLRLF